MTTRIHVLRLFLAFGLAAALAGCNGSGSSGTLNLSITDTPVDGAQSVVVAFTGVDILSPSGVQSFTFTEGHVQIERSVDLLKLQGSASENLLAGVSVPSGNYQGLRLDIDPGNSYIVTSTGAKFPLSMPSGNETGLKIASGFTVEAGNVTDFMIDFDLRKSLTQSTSGGVTIYTLKPSLRLSDPQQAGSISGTVSPSLSIGGTPITDPSCSPAVYVFQGADANPIIGYTYPAPYIVTTTTEQPLASAAISLDATSGTYTYTVGFLDPGAYTVAVTCAAMDKLPDPNVLTTVWLSFSATQNATVTEGGTSTINF